MKICASCKINKPDYEFNKSSKNKDGMHSYCRKCQREKNMTYQKRKIMFPKITFTNNVQKHNALESFSNNDLFSELRRRGFSGKLITKQEIEL